ncbi:MAG: hypothetical protein JWP47_879 [Polaromonas sp.]|nr:hypothetical protein [Polaromonas sp.]
MWKRVCRMRRRGAILFGRARPGNHCYAMKVPTLRARLATEVRGSRDFAANCLRSCGADPVRLTCKRGCFRFRENSTINKTMQKANPSRLAFLLWRTMYGIVRSSRLLLICPSSCDVSREMEFVTLLGLQTQSPADLTFPNAGVPDSVHELLGIIWVCQFFLFAFPNPPAVIDFDCWSMRFKITAFSCWIPRASWCPGTSVPSA